MTISCSGCSGTFCHLGNLLWDKLPIVAPGQQVAVEECGLGKNPDQNIFLDTYGQVHFPIRSRPFSNLYRYILQQGQLGHALRQPVTVEECGLSENPAPMMEDWEPPPRLPSWLGYSQPRGVCHFQVLPIFFLQKDFQPLQLQSFLKQGHWPAVTYMKGLNSCQLRAWPNIRDVLFMYVYA